jgi:signal transduction histidine kinase
MLGWLDIATGTVLVAVAALSWRGRRRHAVLVLATGLAWFAGDLEESLLLVHRPLLLHAALALPIGRVSNRYARLLLALWWAAALVQPLGTQPVVAMALAASTAAEAWRLRTGPPWGRRHAAVTASRVVVALALAVAVPALLRLERIGALPPEVLVGVYDALVATAAALLLADVVLRSPAGETDAVIELSAATPEQALAALRGAASNRDDAAGRGVIERAVELLEANAALQAGLAEQVEEVLASRARLVEAAVAERSRLERLLADGTMTYLDELSGVLHALRGRRADADELIDACLDEVGHIREDLEQLARGLHPRTLAEDGLAAALAELAAGNPLPTTVTAPTGRFPPAAETAVWYACSEALTNVTKHARATKALVDVRLEASELRALVRDDGVGGARVDPGGGLAGLVDRLATIGGVMTLHRAPGGGTDVRITVPV